MIPYINQIALLPLLNHIHAQQVPEFVAVMISLGLLYLLADNCRIKCFIDWTRSEFPISLVPDPKYQVSRVSTHLGLS